MSDPACETRRMQLDETADPVQWDLEKLTRVRKDFCNFTLVATGVDTIGPLRTLKEARLHQIGTTSWTPVDRSRPKFLRKGGRTGGPRFSE